MDKTLKDYIDRAQKKIEEDRKIPLKENSNQYLVYPEVKEDEEKPVNPYGQH